MTDISYKVIFSRRRSISIIVNPDRGVMVRAPYGSSMKSIETYVNKKSDWIRKHLKGFSESKRIRNGKRYIDGECHMLLGREYLLNITSSLKPFVSQHDNIIEVGLDRTDDCERVKSYLERWYQLKASEFISRKLNDILTRHKDYGFSPTKLSVKPLKSRWGSCTSKQRITVNADLVKLDEIFTEYVIIHELCHLRHHNHGAQFYKLLSELFPDWKRTRAELRKYIR
jgi:predicted metal-dependent hydrolase